MSDLVAAGLIVLCAFGFLAVVVLVIPWVVWIVGSPRMWWLNPARLVEAYWDWCFAKQAAYERKASAGVASVGPTESL